MKRVVIHIVLVLFCLGFKLVSHSQHNDTTSRTHLIYASYGYNRAPRNLTFTTGGGRFEIGLNVAKFFSNKFFLGVTFGTNFLFSQSVNQNLSNEFITDFNNNFILDADNLEDSAYALTLKNAINGEDKFGIPASLCNSYGILFSPFPDRYGAVSLQVNFTRNALGFYGVNNIRPRISDEHSNLTSLRSINSWQFMLKFKPYYFFDRGRIIVFEENRNENNLQESKIKNGFITLAKLTIVSFYLETLSYKNSGFAGKPLNDYVKQPFLDKYGKDYHFGFRIALGLY